MRGEARRGETMRSEARRGEAIRGEVRRARKKAVHLLGRGHDPKITHQRDKSSFDFLTRRVYEQNLEAADNPYSFAPLHPRRVLSQGFNDWTAGGLPAAGSFLAGLFTLNNIIFWIWDGKLSRCLLPPKIKIPISDRNYPVVFLIIPVGREKIPLRFAAENKVPAISEIPTWEAYRACASEETCVTAMYALAGSTIPVERMYHPINESIIHSFKQRSNQ